LNKAIIDDGFNSEFVETALFEGILEIPIINKPKEIIIPNSLIPFSKTKYSTNHDEFVAFYENDTHFSNVLRSPDNYDSILSQFPGVVTLDTSLYVDMPLVAQIANVYRSRAIGYYWQNKGYYVIPNIRWGDERSYSTCELPEKFAFLGAPKNSILSIGTYGCCQSREEKYHLKAGLESMLETLTPKVVIVYGPMNPRIFGDYEHSTTFVNYPDWTSSKKGGCKNGNK